MSVYSQPSVLSVVPPPTTTTTSGGGVMVGMVVGATGDLFVCGCCRLAGLGRRRQVAATPTEKQGKYKPVQMDDE